LEGAELEGFLALAAAADSELRALEYVPPLVVAQPADKGARAAAAMKAAAAMRAVRDSGLLRSLAILPMDRSISRAEGQKFRPAGVPSLSSSPRA
jgi:hypothetical protein